MLHYAPFREAWPQLLSLSLGLLVLGFSRRRLVEFLQGMYPSLCLNEEGSFLLMFTDVSGLLYPFGGLEEDRPMMRRTDISSFPPASNAHELGMYLQTKCAIKMDIHVVKVQGCNADASESITTTLPSLVLLDSPPCAYQIPNTMICFCIAKGPCAAQPGWSLLQRPEMSFTLLFNFTPIAMVSFHQCQQNKMLLRGIVWVLSCTCFSDNQRCMEPLSVFGIYGVSCQEKD